MVWSGRTQRAITYARQSTYKEESASLETQVEHCLAANARLGYVSVGDPVIDADLSGRDFKRRSIGPIIERIRSGEADIVMVWKWSRWGRNIRESLNWIAELEEAGGRLEAATEPIDGSTPVGKFSISQMLLAAQLVSDQIGDSWRDARRGMVIRRALPPTGGQRLGYIYDPSTKLYTPHPTVGPIVAEAYDRYVNGSSVWAITLWLRGLGVTTTRGGQVTEPSLRVSLDSGFAAGLIRLNKPGKILTPEQLDTLCVDGDGPVWLPNITPDGGRSWEPLISEDAWTQYVAVRAGRKMTPPRSRYPRTPLAGLLRCAGCNRPMTFRPDRARWRCPHEPVKDQSNPCPVRVTISGRDATDAVRAWLAEHRDPSRDLEGETARRMLSVAAVGDVAAIERGLADLGRQKDRLVAAVRDGLLDAEDIRSQRAAITEAVGRLSADLVAARRRAKTSVVPPRDVFGVLLDSLDGGGAIDAGRVNTRLRDVIDAVWVYPFRDDPRVRVRAVWEDWEAPRAAAPDLDGGDGRVCLGCRVWQPAGVFLRRPSGRLTSRCVICRSTAHRAWRGRQAADSDPS